ncbi:UNVERIFIED_CONTAM: hypothetical protein RMT77_011584 [Armadillidium vulgare]
MKRNKKEKYCQGIGSLGPGPYSLRKRGDGGRSSLERSKLSLQTDEMGSNNPEVQSIGTSNSPAGLSEEPLDPPNPDNQPQKKRKTSYNCRGAIRSMWSEGEKREIFWCLTYARHEIFPRKDTSKRAKAS